MGRLKTSLFSFKAKGKIGVGRKALVGVAPPVVIEHGTIDAQITIGTDDGWARTGSFNNNGIQLYCGCRAANDSYRTFLRYPGITIPAASPIITCYLELHGAGTDGVPLTTLYMENTPDPPAPTSIAEMDAAVAARTAAGVNWLAAIADLTWGQSPELKTILQEIVTARGGLAAEAIQFLWLEQDANRAVCDGMNRQLASTKENLLGQFAAKLHIEF